MIYHWREMYSIPLDAINGSPYFTCVVLPTSDTEHKQLPQTSEPEALVCNIFNMKESKDVMYYCICIGLFPLYLVYHMGLK